MRICSLVPGGTEVLYALGLGRRVLGISHACDYPPAVRGTPRIVRPQFNPDRHSGRAIDAAVRRLARRGDPPYRLDAPALRRLRPDVIVTQSLCEVCAVSGVQLGPLVEGSTPRPEVVSLHAHRLEGIFADIKRIGRATQTPERASALVASLRGRLAALARRLAGAPRPRVVCLEWLDPLMACGHWVPEMVGRAGGREMVGRAGRRSRRIDPAELEAAAPDILILMPCGWDIRRTRKDVPALRRARWWRRVSRACRRVAVVDGNAYFSRSGPRVVDGVELLAAVLHPERCRGLRTAPYLLVEP
jgi:iron complex transport system substrate-binding protein